MRVLSLFDGCAGARQALDNLNIECEYYASEIDSYAIKIALKNYPDIIQLGDIKKIDFKKFENNIDLLIGGSPCQDLSRARHGKGLEGEKSSLFYLFYEALKIVKPKAFLLENVATMTNFNKRLITSFLDVEPVMINSKHFTSQNRQRYYWSNMPIGTPTWSGPGISDVIGVEAISLVEKRTEEAKAQRRRVRKETGKDFTSFRDKVLVERQDNIANCITACKSVNMQIKTSSGIRYLTPLECERLQGMKDNYTAGISNTQRYKMIGNGFTIPVIEYILKDIL